MEYQTQIIGSFLPLLLFERWLMIIMWIILVFNMVSMQFMIGDNLNFNPIQKNHRWKNKDKKLTKQQQ